MELSIFSKMSAMAKAHNAINLSQGFPDFESDVVLLNLVTKAIKDGYNQYAPMEGDVRLREKISEKTQKLHSRFYHPATEITITAGATQAIFTAIASCISDGDEVIVFTPAYDCYAPTVALFGGTVVPIQLSSPLYTPNWEQVRENISARTKMIIINSPHNPSGSLFSKEDMLQLQEISEENELLVISDEVYEHIIFDGNIHYSAAQFEALSKRSFITASFGKTFHNTGWKLGYCLAPAKLMKPFQNVHQYNVFCVNHPFQKALSAYMNDTSTYLSLPNFYQGKRDYFLSLLKSSRFTILPSKGTYFQLLGFSNISQEHDVCFAERLTKELGVATIPTSVFNQNCQDFKEIRVCFAKKETTLKKAAMILNAI